MLQQIEGSAAVAQAVAACRPEVIAAYPITPQTHIVEGLGDMVKRGLVGNCHRQDVTGCKDRCIHFLGDLVVVRAVPNLLGHYHVL